MDIQFHCISCGCEGHVMVDPIDDTEWIDPNVPAHE